MTSTDGAPVTALPSIVVADDELHLLDLVATIIEDLGYTVIRASDGEIALRSVLQHQPVLLITDVMMPRVRGDELCRRLKDIPATADIPVVLLTSLPRGNVDSACAAAFVDKPFSIEYLEAVVRNLLNETANELA